MNKDEIRHDPIKERIVSFIEYIIEKKNTFFYIAIVVVAVIASTSFYFNSLSKSNKKGWEKNQDAMSDFFSSLSSENLFNSSIADSSELKSSIEKFNQIAMEHSGTTSADFALLKTIRGEILLNNFDKVEEVLINGTLSSSDKNLNYQFNRLKGDVFFDRGMNSEALTYYEKSISLSNTEDLRIPIQIKKIYVLIEMGEYKKAETVINSIDKSDIGFSEKNSLLEVEYFIKNKLK